MVTIGVSGIVGGLFHLLDGPGIAKEIGFTRGYGGFQTEVGFGDLALGVAAVLCIWIRDRYWLAILVVATAHRDRALRRPRARAWACHQRLMTAAVPSIAGPRRGCLYDAGGGIGTGGERA